MDTMSHECRCYIHKKSIVSASWSVLGYGFATSSSYGDIIRVNVTEILVGDMVKVRTST